MSFIRIFDASAAARGLHSDILSGLTIHGPRARMEDEEGEGEVDEDDGRMRFSRLPL